MRLNIKQLMKRYGNDTILQIPTFEIENIRSLAIIGPSGGGKSTLLQILGTIESCEADTLEVNGTSLLDKDNRRAYRKEMGYVFQSNNLFPHLTVLQNITLPLVHTYGMKKEEAERKAMAWLEKVGIAEHKDKKPSQISGGQNQRAAIVRALVNGGALLLLDEPTSALDPQLAYEVMQTLLKIKEESDVILVTHELNFARRFADYYLFVDEAQIISHGPIEQLFEESNPKVRDFVNMVEFK